MDFSNNAILFITLIQLINKIAERPRSDFDPTWKKITNFTDIYWCSLWKCSFSYFLTSEGFLYPLSKLTFSLGISDFFSYWWIFLFICIWILFGFEIQLLHVAQSCLKFGIFYFEPSDSVTLPTYSATKNKLADRISYMEEGIGH